MTHTPLNVLHIDDHPEGHAALQRLLHASPGTYTYHAAETTATALQIYADVRPDCVLAAYDLPGAGWRELVGALNRNIQGTACALLVIGDANDDRIGEQVTRYGAYDYLVQHQLTPGSLHRAIQRAVAAARAQRQINTQRAHRELWDEINDLLESPLGIEQRLHRLAQRLAGTVADWCVITLVHNQQARQVAMVHAAELPSFQNLFDAVYGCDQDNPTGLAQVVQHGAVAVWRRSRPDESFPHFTPDQRQALETLRAAVVISAPLQFGQQVFGLLCLGTAAQDRLFDDVDQCFVGELARRTAASIEHARLSQAVQQSLHERDMFLSIASHELRNPLTTLLGRAQLLQRRAVKSDTLSERDQRDIQVISEQSERVNALLRDLLDTSRLGRGQLEFAQRHLDLSLVLYRVAGEVQPTLHNRTLTISGADQPLTVIGDELRLEQVFRNILHNAVKYSADGSAISINASAQARWIEIAIADQGIGIPTEALPQLFQRFYRASNAAQLASGTGLGLYIVQEIVQRHRGSVRVASTEGQGSTFTVRLPRAANSA